MKVRLLTVALAIYATQATAQEYPAKPILFVIPFAPGGDSDLCGRNVAHNAPKYWGNRPIISFNRVGASGAIGASSVRNAAPDGYTLLVGRIATHAVLPVMDSKLAYKWNEFTMISLIELNPYVCFGKTESSYRTVADLIGVIRKSPGKLNYATAGMDTSQNMAVQYLLSLAGLTKDHAVAIHYKGGGEVTTAVVGNQVDFACNNAPTVIPMAQAGRVRALLVTPTRIKELPDTPSAKEAGFPDMEKIVGWTARMGPPGLPKIIVDKWAGVFARLAADPDWQTGIVAIRSPADTEKYVKEQFELYDKLVIALGIRQ
mgnify:CR=1 FL=1